MKEIKSFKNTTNNKQPSNLEAEQALIGSILVNNDIIDEVSIFVGGGITIDAAPGEGITSSFDTLDATEINGEVKITFTVICNF